MNQCPRPQQRSWPMMFCCLEPNMSERGWWGWKGHFAFSEVMHYICNFWRKWEKWEMQKKLESGRVRISMQVFAYDPERVLVPGIADAICSHSKRLILWKSSVWKEKRGGKQAQGIKDWGVNRIRTMSPTVLARHPLHPAVFASALSDLQGHPVPSFGLTQLCCQMLKGFSNTVFIHFFSARVSWPSTTQQHSSSALQCN